MDGNSQKPTSPGLPGLSGAGVEASQGGAAAAPASGTPVPAGLPASFRVVAIGASAGGLEAVTALLDTLRPDTNMVFILVQHQAVQGPHLLQALLARHTRMSVVEAEDGLRIVPNHLYLNPPDSGLILENGALKTYLRPTEHERPQYIDALFESVAREKQSLAVGVLLSGLDSDGVRGMKSIQQAGGVTFAQNSTARFSELPAHAISATPVDFVLTAAGIADKLSLLGRLPVADRDSEAPEQPAFEQTYIAGVLEQVKQAANLDFTSYKLKTIQRRLWRRMLLSKLTNPDDYLQLIKQNPQEAVTLAHDFLITVTSFFRESDVFQVLKNRIFPEFVKLQSEGRPLRVWVPGCSTGEEAYSIGMAYLEFLAEMATNPQLQIFATDLSPEAISKARQGIYQEAELEGLSEERRKRFFTRVDGRYQVSQPVRNMCIFAVQNVLTAPPISHVDLISCCNLFIYLDNAAQRQVVKVFHYALNVNGYLILGSSESIGFAMELFELADGRTKIYKKKDAALQAPVLLPPLALARRAAAEWQPTAVESPPPEERLLREIDHLVLAEYAPVGFVINDQMDIVQFRGDTGPLLQPDNFVPSLNLFRMVRPELHAVVREAIDQARSSGRPVSRDHIPFLLKGNLVRHSLTVVPLYPGGSGASPYYLLLFTPIEAAALLEKSTLVDRSDANEPDAGPQHKREMVAAQRYIQELKEEHATAVEELRAAMEEAQSNNEELQSTVEELESTKEELQSNNEELNTINEELYTKNNELIRAYDDLNNLLDSLNIAFIILDAHGRIRRYSARTTEAFNLIESDIGRPLNDIKPTIDLPPLQPLIDATLQNMETRSLTVKGNQGKAFQLRIRPYKTAEKQIEGVVLMVQEQT